MGLFEKLRLSLSSRTRLMAELAGVAGCYEALAANLKRHAQLCAYPNIKAGLEQLAVSESAQARKLRAVLLDRGSWPRPWTSQKHDGFNNWERLNNDLALGSDLLRALNRQSVEWETVDAALAASLRELMLEEDGNLELLRDLTLKCDPQALD